MLTTAEKIIEDAAKKEAAYKRRLWIINNMPEVNRTWQLFMGRKMTKQERQGLTGDIMAPSFKQLNQTLSRFQRYEPYVDALKAGGIDAKTFKKGEVALEFYAGLDTQFGSAGNLTRWLSLAATWRTQHPGEVAKLRDIETAGKYGKASIISVARQLQRQYGSVENYTLRTGAETKLAAEPDYIRRAFGDDLLRKAYTGIAGYETIGDEIVNYEAVRLEMMKQGMDVGNLSRGRVSEIIGRYGNAANYARWLTGEDVAASYSNQLRDFTSLGFTNLSTADLQQKYYEGTDLESLFTDFKTRKNYLYKSTGVTTKTEERGANPELGAWWREE